MEITFLFLLVIQSQCFILSFSFLHGSLLWKLLLHKNNTVVTVYRTYSILHNGLFCKIYWNSANLENLSFVHLYFLIFHYSIQNDLASNKLPECQNKKHTTSIYLWFSSVCYFQLLNIKILFWNHKTVSHEYRGVTSWRHMRIFTV